MENPTRKWSCGVSPSRHPRSGNRGTAAGGEWRGKSHVAALLVSLASSLSSPPDV